MIEGNIAQRLASLQLGDASLVFGRIDRTQSAGRRHASTSAASPCPTSTASPLVVDWRAPVAEPFYRATGRSADGPRPPPPLRHPGPPAARHRGRALRRGRRPPRRRAGRRRRGPGDPGPEHADRRPRGGPHRPAQRHRRHDPGRAGRDHPLPSCPGVLVVQGGPGTGKTVVALHRAAYLLYTHRFPLEGQGVLVVGPNRLFLGYIEQVLPEPGRGRASSWPSWPTCSTRTHALDVEGRDLPDHGAGQGRPAHGQGARQGRARPPASACAARCASATASRPSASRPSQSRAIVADAKRRFRLHNAGRRHVEAERLRHARRQRPRCPSRPHEVRERLRHAPEVREALERMWPVLTPGRAAPRPLRLARR